jgi:SlyX protein
MLDPQRLRANPEAVALALAARGFQLDLEAYHSFETRRKKLQVETQTLQAERNAKSKSIGQAKARGEDLEPLLASVADLGDRLGECEQALEARLVELEMRVSFQEHALAELSDALADARMQGTRNADVLRVLLEDLGKVRNALNSSDPASEPPPPHY